MTCDSNDNWVFSLGPQFEVLSNLFGGLYSVQDRHAEIRENNLVTHPVLVGLFDLHYGLFAVNAEVHLEVTVDAKALKNSTHRGNTEFLVIDY